MTADDASTSTRVARRWPKRTAIASATVVVVVGATTTAGGWYYADELLLVDTSPIDYPVEVLDVGTSTVTLVGEDADQPGVTGLEWDGGYARLGPEIERDGDRVVRPFAPFPDVPGAGIRARVSFYAHPADPDDFRKVSGVETEEVRYVGPLGSYPATYLRGELGRWVVHVHGRGGNRAEAFRLMPALHRLGYPQLSISYRNDDDAPAAPDGRYGLGWAESDDLAAALEYARRHGADDVVLVGYSMGGAVVGNYLRVHGDGRRVAGPLPVAGVVYDSPVLSWHDILADESRNRNLPAVAGRIAGAVVRLRTGIDIGAMDQVAHAGDLTVPILLFHGSGDPTVPVRSSDALAEARPDLVTYRRPEGVGHVQAWNNDAAGYEAAVTAFLDRLH